MKSFVHGHWQVSEVNRFYVEFVFDIGKARSIASCGVDMALLAYRQDLTVNPLQYHIKVGVL